MLFPCNICNWKCIVMHHGNVDFFQVKTLAFQNQKLGHRLTQRIAMEEDLRSRIDQVCAIYSYFFIACTILGLFYCSWRSGRHRTTLS